MSPNYLWALEWVRNQRREWFFLLKCLHVWSAYSHITNSLRRSLFQRLGRLWSRVSSSEMSVCLVKREHVWVCERLVIPHQTRSGFEQPIPQLAPRAEFTLHLHQRHQAQTCAKCPRHCVAFFCSCYTFFLPIKNNWNVNVYIWKKQKQKQGMVFSFFLGWKEHSIFFKHKEKN